jgi:hypothetical protein
VVARPAALCSDGPVFGLVADAEFSLVPEMASAVNRACQSTPLLVSY